MRIAGVCVQINLWIQNIFSQGSIVQTQLTSNRRKNSCLHAVLYMIHAIAFQKQVFCLSKIIYIYLKEACPKFLCPFGYFLGMRHDGAPPQPLRLQFSDWSSISYTLLPCNGMAGVTNYIPGTVRCGLFAPLCDGKAVVLERQFIGMNNHGMHHKTSCRP